MVGTELGADEAPAPTRFWLRTCNGQAPGALIGVVEADWQSRQVGVAGTLATGLTWTAASAQDPRLPPREFELVPLTDAQARDWIRANHTTKGNS